MIFIAGLLLLTEFSFDILSGVITVIHFIFK